MFLLHQIHKSVRKASNTADQKHVAANTRQLSFSFDPALIVTSMLN